MSLLQLKDIHKSYYLGKEEFPVLKGIDLSFEQGDFISILGESGGGKIHLDEYYWWTGSKLFW